MHNSTPSTTPADESPRELDEFALAEEWSLTNRLQGLSHAALVMESEGWTIEDATPYPEGWPVGELTTTASTEDNLAMVYRVHLDPDGRRWWHSIEEPHATFEQYLASPVGSAIPLDYAEWWLRDRRRMRELADQKMNETLKEFLDR